MRKHLQRLIGDADLRRYGGLAGGLAVDGLWALLNLGLGAFEQSVWLGAFSGLEDAALNSIMPILTGTAIALALTYLGARSLRKG